MDFCALHAEKLLASGIGLALLFPGQVWNCLIHPQILMLQAASLASWLMMLRLRRVETSPGLTTKEGVHK